MIKIKIITALNNPDLNNKLNKEKKIEIVCKDIIYKDGIIDILKENKNIDLIFINQNIFSEISDEELIKKIKEINEKIKIIYILEKQNKNIELILKENNINNIYYNSEINYNKIMKIIYNIENIPTKEDEQNNNYENNFSIYNTEEKNKNSLILNKFLKNKLNNKKILFKKNNKYNNLNHKMIMISGPPNIGKTNFIINLFKIINNKKILIIDFSLNNSNIFYILKKEKYSKKINELLRVNNINNIKKIIINNIKKNIDKIIENKKNEKNINYSLNDYNEFENIINFFLIKLNNNKFIISCLDLISDFFNKSEDEKIKIFFDLFFNYIKNNYDLILFDIDPNNNLNINKIIFENSSFNIILFESNLAGINKLKNYLEKNYFLDNINLVINKKDKYSIDKNIISGIFNLNVIGEIKYKIFYSNLINRNYNYFYNFKNNYKKEYINIIKKI